MIISELRTYFFKELKEGYPEEEIHSFFYLLTEYYLNMKRLDVSLHLNQLVSEKSQLKFEQAINRLKSQEPIQYILGETAFLGRSFKVTPATLIPRPETEELVYWIVSHYVQASEGLSILDIGTGSGCIAVSLGAELNGTEITAIDVSEEAINIAKKNANQHKVGVNFVQIDVLDGMTMEAKFDLIVSNPPYVRMLEKTQMQPNVLNHEPSLALFVSDQEPLIFYHKIAQFAKSNLREGGHLFFEINEYLSKELVQLLQKEGFKSVEVMQDLFGKDRMLKCNLHEKS